MNKILFDTGIEEYEIGGGILRLNASDVNLYGRFFRVEDKILEIEYSYTIPLFFPKVNRQTA